MARTKEDYANVWRGLESAICDVANMTTVCRILMERYQDEFRGLESEQFSKATAMQLTQAAAEPLMFCVHYLNDAGCDRKAG